MTIIQGNNNIKCWRGYGKTGTLYTLLVGMQINIAIMKAVWRFLKITRNRTAI
jgi:hypothetical protein